MGISVQEFRTRIGLFYSRATRLQKSRILNIDDVVFVNLYCVLGPSSVPTMLLHLSFNIHVCNDKPDFENHWDFHIVCIKHTNMVNDTHLFHEPNENLLSKCSYGIVLIIFICFMLIYLCGDIELNPGPSSTSSDEPSLSSTSDSVIDEFQACLNHFISFMHLNIQSIVPKIDLINLELRNLDILCFTETWLKPSIGDDSITLDSFHAPFRCDRVDRHGGGVAVYVKKHLHVQRRNDLEVPGLESVWIELKLKNNHSVLIGTFYRPPDSRNQVFDLIEYSFEMAVDTNIDTILVLGDFNEDMFDHRNQNITSILRTYSFNQFISDATHHTETSASLIDLVICNNSNSVDLVHVGEPFVHTNMRYHCPIYGILKFQNPSQHCFKRKIWLYDQGDYDSFREILRNVNWDEILNSGDNLDTIVDLFTNTILHAAEDTIPNKTIMVRKSEPLWMNNRIRRAIRQRNRMHKRAKKSNLPDHWQKFRKIRNSTVNLIRKEKDKYFNSLIEKLTSRATSIKDWWKIASKIAGFNKKDSEIPPLHYRNNIIYDDCAKAEAFNSFFSAHSNLQDVNKSLPDDDSPPDRCLDNITLHEYEVQDVLRLLNTNKASGPDSISARLLKVAHDILSKPLCAIFNLSLSQKYFPNVWKLANVIPVFKKDLRNLVENYRPISLLSVVSKTFEKCIYKHIFNFIRELITEHQSGFTLNDSTTNQLLYLAHVFSKALDEGKEIRIIFFDISKAFDRVWHKGLLFKLKKMGIVGNLLLWLKDYLSNRKQRVVINGKESSWENINAGVPQGSILGPLLFLIFINDIVSEVNCPIKLFADDTSIYAVVENPLVASIQLNSDLQKIHDWSTRWLVNFNPRKTESIIISRKCESQLHPPLYMNHVEIQTVTSHKHLGLIFSQDGSWISHIDEIIAKANSRLNIIRRLKFKLDRRSLEQMYFSYIRPLLEYSDVIWDNCPDYMKGKLEKINCEAARIVTGATKLTSIDLLYRECGWEKLENRRKIHKLALFHKMVYQQTPEYLSNLVPSRFNEIHQHRTRGSTNIMPVPARTAFHYNSFLPSTVRLWNDLPVNIKNSNSVKNLKNLMSEKKNIPCYFYTGSRIGQILHARLRTLSSSLKDHLFNKNLETDPFCICKQIETSEHFLLDCHLYDNIRNPLFANIIGTRNANNLLFGNPLLSDLENISNFTIVQDFILKSKRFT